MKKIVNRYILGSIVSLVLLAGCKSIVEEPEFNEVSAGLSSLTIDMSLPIEIQTRTIATDPLNNGGTWNEWEKYVDGSLLYNVTLLVIDSDNQLVGYRQIHANSSDVSSLNGFYDGNSVNAIATSGSAVKITFPQSDPLHGNIELLKSGNYTLIAVANYAPVTSGTNVYAGLGNAEEDGSGNYNGNGDFSAIVSNIIKNFSGASGLPGFTSANYPSFFKYRLDAGDDRICKLNPQPLVMIRKVTLNEGNNIVQGELSRTFARIRLDVNNRSESSFLDVSSLSFNGSYASKSAYLLNDAEAGNSNIFPNFSLFDGNSDPQDNTKGVLGVTSHDAIVPAATSSHRILAGATEPIFDAYILEGKIDASADFTFTFSAKYAAKMEDGDATHNAMIANFFSNNKYNGSSSGGGMGGYWGYTSYGIIDPAFYLFIRSNTSNVSTCLKADVANMKAVVANANAGNEQSSSFKMSPEFIWEMEIPGGSSSVKKEGNGFNSYVEYAPGYLKSLSSNLYLQPYDGGESKVPNLGTTPGNVIFKMDFGGEDEHGTVFCQYNGSYYYLNGTTCEWAGPEPNMDNYKMQTFETIIAEPVTPKEAEVTSHLIETVTGGTTIQRYEVGRNEFYHGIIPVNVQN